MSNNKYKNKINKEKEKCNKLINKLYGDKFYFLHGTTSKSIENILKSGTIKLGTHTKERNFYKNNMASLPYVYCNIEFDDVPININNNYPLLFPYILLIHPKIIINHNLIFNKQWSISPTSDSIYINKEDNFNKNKKKLEEIKKSLIKIKNKTEFRQNYHEILFKEDINLKDNLLGIIYKYNEDKTYILELLKKYNYKNIKIYNNINNFPLLCDLLI